jgi:tRNA (guanosine-2'-O-)-methyltransferase
LGESWRRKIILDVATQRQGDFTVILENVRDPHNIAAVLRSCDSVGIKEIYLLITEPDLQLSKIAMGGKSSSGTRKWVDVYLYTDLGKCYSDVRKKYRIILAAHSTSEEANLYDLDLTKPTAMIFGNEHDGLSAEAFQKADGIFSIPQVGMVNSLNISVACAVCIYEAFRQRSSKNFYKVNNTMTEAEKTELISDYLERHKSKHKGLEVIRMDKSESK